MKKVTLKVDDGAHKLFSLVAEQAGLTPEQVMADALFKLAGELSLEALHKTGK